MVTFVSVILCAFTKQCSSYLKHWVPPNNLRRASVSIQHENRQLWFCGKIVLCVYARSSHVPYIIWVIDARIFLFSNGLLRFRQKYNLVLSEEKNECYETGLIFDSRKHIIEHGYPEMQSYRVSYIDSVGKQY